MDPELSMDYLSSSRSNDERKLLLSLLEQRKIKMYFEILTGLD